MMRKRELYVKVIIAEIVAYIFSLFLVNYIFLGPLPIVRPSFEKVLYNTPSFIAQKASEITKSFFSGFVGNSEKTSGTTGERQRGGFVFDTPTPEVSREYQNIPTSIFQRPTITSDGSFFPSPTEIRVITLALSPTPKTIFRLPTIPPLFNTPTNIPSQTISPQPTQSQSSQSVENEAVRLINERRSGLGLRTLKRNSILDSAARKHADDITRTNPDATTNPHVGSDGSTPQQRGARAGYRGGIGEVIYKGPMDSQLAVESWFNSPKHKETLVLKSAKDIGVAFTSVYGVAMIGY